MKTVYTKIFAQRLKKIRTNMPKNQDKLAAEIGYSQSAIAHWEAGNREPSIEVVANFACYFNTSLDYLLGMCDDIQPYDGNIGSSFQERLKDLRLEKSMTQSQLAEITEISQSAIAAWEVGLNSPKIEAFVKLAKFFNVSAEYLFGVEY